MQAGPWEDLASAFEARHLRRDGDSRWQAIEGWFGNGGGALYLRPADDPDALDGLAVDVIRLPDLAAHNADPNRWRSAQVRVAEDCARPGTGWRSWTRRPG